MPPAPRVPRLSGLQKQVLALYRSLLRTARTLPVDGPSRESLVGHIVREFRAKARSVDKLDFQRIEFLLRQAKKQAGHLSASANGVSGFATSASGGGAHAPVVRLLTGGGSKGVRAAVAAATQQPQPPLR
jgi:succinate dehydrogenase assembly factor 1